MDAQRFRSDVAAIFIDEEHAKSFGSGRLIATNLVLTARHVVDVPDGQPVDQGWHVRLIGERDKAGCWTGQARAAHVVWRGPGDLDLALLQLDIGCQEAPEKPTVEIVFASYCKVQPLDRASATGFPEARWERGELVREHTATGQLADTRQNAPFDWTVSEASKPDNPNGWKGMSGGVIARELGEDMLYVFGAVQQIPAGFSHGLLEAARLSAAFEDEKFRALLATALGEQPQLVPWRAPAAPLPLRRGPIAYNIPNLPLHYQPRESDLTDLRTKLRGAQATIGIIGLRGMGGIGKTVIATALARDVSVKADFPDGIAWLTFGRDAPALIKAAELANTITGQTSRFDSFDGARGQLGEITRDVAVLIVLDDIWEPEAADPFTCLGPKCRVLITTRYAGVLSRANAHLHNVGLLTPPAARDFLAAATGLSSAAALPTEADAIIRRCGHLPLALAAAGALIRRGTYSWADTLQALEEGAAEEFDCSWLPDSEQRNVAVVLRVSVERLPAHARACFLACAAFREGVDIPEAALLRVWSGSVANERLGRRMAEELEARSLLMCDEQRRYRIHDLYVDYLHHAAAPLAARHAALVDSYRTACPTGWGCVLDDGYIHDHLVWHLIEAGLLPELHRIFRDEHDGANVWFLARHLAGYLNDLQAAACAVSGAAGLEVRYAMMSSSVASLESNASWGLLTELIRRKVWSEERAWAHATALPPSQRSIALKLFIEFFEETFRARCFSSLLEDVAAVADKEKFSQLLNVPQVLSHGQMDLLLESAKGAKVDRAKAVVAVLSHFAAAERVEKLFEELHALEKTDLGMEWGTPLTMSKLARGLPRFSSAATTERLLAEFPEDSVLKCCAALRLAELNETDRALSIATASPYEDVLVHLAKYLSPEQLKRATIATANITHEPSRVLALAAIYDRHPEPMRTELLKELWRGASKDARSLMVPFLPAEIVGDLPLPSSDNEKRELVKRLVALGLTNRLLELLAPGSRQLSFELEIAAAALSDADLVRLGANNPKADPWVLAALLPDWARRGHVAEAVTLLPHVRVERLAFDRCVERLSPHIDDNSLVRVLSISDAIDDQKPRIRCLIELAASAPDQLEADLLALPIEMVLDHQGILAVARRLPTAIAAKLHASLRSPLNRLAVATAHEPPAGGVLIDDLAAATEHIEKKLEEIKNMPLAAWGEIYRDLRSALDYFVCALTICAPEHRKAVFDLGRRASDPFGIDAMKPYITFHSVKAAIAATLRPQYGQLSTHRLCSLAALLDGEDRRMLEDRFEKCFATDDDYKFVSVIHDVADVSPRLLDRAFTRSKRIPGQLGLIGLPLVEYLARVGRIGDALTIAERVGDPLGAVRAQVALAVHAPMPAASAYLDEAWSIIFRDEYGNRNWNDARHIGPLIPPVLDQPKHVVESLWRRALRIFRRQPRHDMFEYLAPLCPMIGMLGGTDAVVEAYHAAEDVARWWP